MILGLRLSGKESTPPDDDDDNDDDDDDDDGYDGASPSPKTPRRSGVGLL